MVPLVQHLRGGLFYVPFLSVWFSLNFRISQTAMRMPQSGYWRFCAKIIRIRQNCGAERVKRISVSPQIVTLPPCLLPRPGEKVVWYSDSTRRNGILVGHDVNGCPVVENGFGLTQPLDSYDQIRLSNPQNRSGPNWTRLGSRAKVIKPLQQERDALLGLLNRHIPPGPTYLELIEEIWNRGYEIFLVGGTVRDVIAGLKSQDVDMVTSIPLDRAIPLLASMYRHEPSVNKERGFVRLGGTPASGDPFIDLKAMIHSNPGTPNAVFSDNLEHDLRHRDFACNAIYFDPINEIFIDPSGDGVEGAETKRLHLVCDPSRPPFYKAQICVRFFKFAVRGFGFTESTENSIKEFFLPSLPAMPKSALVGYMKAQLLSKTPQEEHEHVLNGLRESMLSFGADAAWRDHIEPLIPTILKRGK